MAGSNVSSVVHLLPRANEGFSTTLGSTILSGAATVPLNSITGLTNGTTFVGIIEPGATNQQVFTGIVDTGGSQITGVKWTRGSNVGHTAGAQIVDYLTGTAFNMLARWAAIEHNDDGTHNAAAAATIAALLPDASVPRASLHWSQFSNSIKQASNTSSITPTNGGDNDFQSAGAKITFTVSGTAYALVTVTVGCSSTSDFEHRPEIFLDSSIHSGANYAATIANAGGRASVRSYSNLVILTNGAHTISAGMYLSAAVSQFIPANSAIVSAIVLGNVTA